jgi:ubiquitin C-terminal hydrolase
LDFGHYYSQCKLENSWFEFNDSKVKLDSLNKESSNVYALFFEKSV